jgi:two-component system, NarL family, response regulator LiaR
MPVRLLIAEDHTVVRQGLQMLLRFNDAIEVVGEAADGRAAVELAHQVRPDVVLMDLLMPVMDGVSATAAIRHDLPEVQVIALTSFLEDHLVAEALRAGAIGYLLKDTDVDSLCQAVLAANAGRAYLSHSAADRLVREVQSPNDPIGLTPREVEVLLLLARGRSNKEISRELSLGQQTVKTYVSSIFSKLDVQSRTQAAMRALQTGLLSPSDVAQP